MNIVKAWPPNIDEIDAAFHVHEQVRKRGIKPFFCYGSTIFNPLDTQIFPPIIVHEETHSTQQRAIGGPAKWWDRYIAEMQFRLEQEIEAHRAEYGKVCQDFPTRRDCRQRALREISRRLAGPLYGHMLTVDQAKREIKSAA